MHIQLTCRLPRMVWMTIGLGLTMTLAAHAQPVILGVNNNSIYNNTASFQVPSTAGYDYAVVLDDEPVPTNTQILVDDPDYHLIEAWRTNQTSQAVETARVQFVVRASERGSSETGLPPWVPYPVIPSAHDEFDGGQLRLVMPSVFPAGYPIPVVAWAVRGEGPSPLRVNGTMTSPGHAPLDIKRGVGSGFLEPVTDPGEFSYTPTIGTLATNRQVQVEPATDWTEVGGVLPGNTFWPEQSRWHVTGHLTIPAGSTLTIAAGTVVALDGGIDITNNGTLVIEGTIANPVVFMPAQTGTPWGGFVMRNTTGEVQGTGVIFTGSGANPNWFGNNGNPGSHRIEQALFYVDDDQSVTLTDAAAIDLAGQFGHARNGGAFVLTRFLNQRCTTGGEFTGADFTVKDSAFLEFPDDTANFVDGDNDGLYLVSGTHGFTNTLFGWTKDDGIDSGGGGSGVFNYQNCWFESNFHEGNSLSGVGKDVRHYDGVFLNNGQGLEVGYDAPTGSVFRCLMTCNLVGARFGDNYDWTYNGFLRAENTISIYNHRDVWGFNWADWTYRVNQMDVQNNHFSSPNPRHPNNEIWDPESDGWRLAAYRGGSARGHVGAGLAVRASQGALAEIQNPLAVGLSVFSTNQVQVDYRVESFSGEILDQGTARFAPGQTLVHLQPNVEDWSGQSGMRLTLHNPVGADITGQRDFFYLPGATNEEPATTELIAAGSFWRYLVTPAEPALDWRAVDFDDAGWPSGQAELGYGDGNEVTVIGYGPNANDKYTTTYFRHSFAVADPAEYDTLDLWLRRDDGGVVYLNGTEIFRSPNMPSGPVDYNTRTVGPNGENTIDQASLEADLLRTGNNVVAVEIHQADPDSSDVSFDFALTGVAPPPSPELRWVMLSGELVLWWGDSGFRLQHAQEVTGPWSTLENASSPHVVSPDQQVGFYRLLRP